MGFGRRTALGAVAVLVVASPAAAEPLFDGDWLVTIGGRAQVLVPYEGAGHDVLVPVPVISLRRPQDPDRATYPGDPFGVSLIKVGGLRMGPSVRVRGRRTAEEERVGLTEINGALEAGGFITYWPVRWFRVHVDGGKGVRGHSAWVGDAGMDVIARPGRWMFSLGPRIGFGSADYMRTYFGVSAAEIAANPALRAVGATPYTPDAGRRYLGGTLTGAYRFNRHWQLTANFMYHHLGDIAEDSPVVQTLGRVQEYNGGVGFKYSFDWTR